MMTSRGGPDWRHDLAAIAAFAAAVAVVPLVTGSGVTLNFVTMTLYAALLAQAWNVLGGYGGQFSFGHAVFFGTGAYLQGIAQVHWGLGAWAALPVAVAGATVVGLVVGGLSFRYGLRGSYFALVTLAFAEVFRILATTVPITGAGVGMMIPLRESAAAMQFASRAGFLWLLLAFVVIALLFTAWLRHSRFGARLQAVRDNEAAAQAVGVDPLRVKLGAIAASAALAGAAGASYLQMFHYIDPGIAYGPAVSVEALVGAIVGGMGTLWGPILGAAVLHLLAETTRNLVGQLPGVNMIVYGVVLILIVLFLPRGIFGFGASVRSAWARARGGERR